jgi:hypothetical protein
MPFTQEQLVAYIIHHNCPYCGCGETQEIDAFGNEEYRMECLRCEKTWWETWSLTTISEEDD